MAYHANHAPELLSDLCYASRHAAELRSRLSFDAEATHPAAGDRDRETYTPTASDWLDLEYHAAIRTIQRLGLAEEAVVELSAAPAGGGWRRVGPDEPVAGGGDHRGSVGVLTSGTIAPGIGEHMNDRDWLNRLVKKANEFDSAIKDAGRYVAEPRPTIVCLCGSTRFYDAFQAANYRETMEGRIVLSIGFYPHSSKQEHGESIGCDNAQKVALDRLHFHKIDLADEVLVLNVGGYIGESTRREIDYAEQQNKQIRYLVI